MNFTDDQALQFTKQDFKNTYRKEIPPAKMGTVLFNFLRRKGVTSHLLYPSQIQHYDGVNYFYLHIFT